MKYDISKATAPAMPNLGKGTECIKFLLTQASEDMHEPLVPMFFPIFGAHICGAEFQYPDFSWKEPTGMMANLVAKSGDNKGQLTTLAKAICRDFSQHDKAEGDEESKETVDNPALLRNNPPLSPDKDGLLFMVECVTLSVGLRLARRRSASRTWLTTWRSTTPCSPRVASRVSSF